MHNPSLRPRKTSRFALMALTTLLPLTPGCLWLTIGATGGAVAGAAAADEQRDAGDVVSDAALVAEVKTALAAAKGVSALRVKVSARLGAVTLKGYVKSEAEAARAVEVARGVSGVKDVISKLVVDSD